MRHFLIFCAMCALVSLVPLPAGATTWYIKADGTGDAPTIQAGIAAASDGDTVLLAAGTFTGVGNYDMDFLSKAIFVLSESGPEVTIIDCQSNGRGFFVKTVVGSSAISGLTIKNGFAAISGGAIYVEAAAPDITNNIIVDNQAGSFGGGLYIKKTSPNVIGNTICGNGAPTGGGIYGEGNMSPTVSQNIIAFSTAGAGIHCKDAGTNPMLSCNNIYSNAGGDALCGTDLGNNMSSDPQFCGVPASGNYFLQSDSPCTMANSPCGMLVGALPQQCGTVSTFNKTWGSVKALYE